MNGVENFLNYVSDNWVSILVVIGVTISVIKMVTKFIQLDNDEKINIVKKQVRETMLKLITEAEIDFEEWNKSGSIKRSKVIADIYEKYPILSKAASQEVVIAWIDSEINSSLKTLREILKENKKEEEKKEE